MYEVLNAADIHLVEMFMPSGRKQTIHETVSGANDFERRKNNTGKTPLSTGCSNPTYFLGLSTSIQETSSERSRLKIAIYGRDLDYNRQ